MSRKKNTTDRQFRDRLRHFEAAPPEQAWRGITSALEQDKRKMKVLWIRRIAASIAVILAVGTLWILLRESPETSLTTRKTPDATSQESPEGSTNKTPEATNIRETPEATDIRETLAEIEIQERHVDKTRSEKQTEAIIPTPSGESMQEVTGIEVAGGITGDPIQTERLMPVPGRPATDFQKDFMEVQTLLATRTYKSALPEEGEGIDLFEELGNDGQASYDKWGVGTQVSPVYTYRNLEVSDGSAGASSYYNDVEEGMASYAAGVNIHFSPLKRLSIQSGLYYSRMGMKVVNAYYAQYNENTFQDNEGARQATISNSTGTIEMQQDMDYAYVANAAPEVAWDITSSFIRSNTFNTTDGEIHQHFEYLELPVILRYRVIDKRLGFNLLGGISTNFLMDSKAYFQEGSNKELIGTTENLRPFNHSSILGVGLDYSVSKRFHINLEPTFRYYLNSINTDSNIKSHPYSIGFYTGLYYTF